MSQHLPFPFEPLNYMLQKWQSTRLCSKFGQVENILSRFSFLLRHQRKYYYYYLPQLNLLSMNCSLRILWKDSLRPDEQGTSPGRTISVYLSRRKKAREEYLNNIIYIFVLEWFSTVFPSQIILFEAHISGVIFIKQFSQVQRHKTTNYARPKC